MCHKKIESAHDRIDHLEIKLFLHRILEKLEDIEEILLLHVEEEQEGEQNSNFTNEEDEEECDLCGCE